MTFTPGQTVYSGDTACEYLERCDRHLSIVRHPVLGEMSLYTGGLSPNQPGATGVSKLTLAADHGRFHGTNGTSNGPSNLLHPAGTGREGAPA